MTDSVAAGEGAAHWKTHRPLQEPVLESVEEEFGVQPPTEQPSRAAIDGNGLDASGQVWWSRLREQVAEQVSQQPARAALLALGAGALTAWLLSQALHRRRERS